MTTNDIFDKISDTNTSKSSYDPDFAILCYKILLSGQYTAPASSKLEED